MNNLYHKVAFASVCTALSFALVTNKEAKAAVITLTPPTTFVVIDMNGQDKVAYTFLDSNVFLPVIISSGKEFRQEYRTFYEFNLGNLSLTPNTVISSAIFAVETSRRDIFAGYASNPLHEPFSRLDTYGYIGNGQADLSDFGAGEYLGGEFLHTIDMNSTINPSSILSSNVLPFISQRVKNNDTFAGFSFRLDEAYTNGVYLKDARLTITTVDVAEPVPEPTTIFGSFIALGVGGWLKRRNLSRQHKTAAQR